MSILDYFRPTKPDPDITPRNAIYRQHKLACPRCTDTTISITRVGQRLRGVLCMNCGYSGSVGDGVEIWKDIE